MTRGIISEFIHVTKWEKYYVYMQKNMMRTFSMQKISEMKCVYVNHFQHKILFKMQPPLHASVNDRMITYLSVQSSWFPIMLIRVST